MLLRKLSTRSRKLAFCKAFAKHVQNHPGFAALVERLDNGENIGLDTEGYDVINFGSSESKDVTQGMIGIGFRSRILKNVDLGLAYEKAIIEPHGLTDDRFTFDVCIRF